MNTSPKSHWETYEEEALERELAASKEHRSGRGYWAPAAIEKRIDAARHRLRVARIDRSIESSAEALAAMRKVQRAAEDLFGVLVRTGQVPDAELADKDMREILRRALLFCPFDAEAHTSPSVPSNVVSLDDARRARTVRR